jgi:hypothetical protein
LSCFDRDGADLWRVAVADDARRSPSHPTIDDVTVTTQAPCIVLDHAGPATSRHARARAKALAGTPVDPVSGRRAEAMTPTEVAATTAAFAAAATRVRALGRRPVLAVDDDGLLHRALASDAGPGARTRVLDVIAACAPCELCLIIEDLAPGGLDPSGGIEFARKALGVSSSTMLIAAGGTAAFQPLCQRRKGNSVDETGLALASAAWLVGRLEQFASVEVYGLVRTVADVTLDRAAVLSRARRLGLDGVVHAPRG